MREEIKLYYTASQACKIHFIKTTCKYSQCLLFFCTWRKLFNFVPRPSLDSAASLLDSSLIFSWQIFGSGLASDTATPVLYIFVDLYSGISQVISTRISKKKMNQLIATLRVLDSLWPNLAQKVDLPDFSQQPKWIWASLSYRQESEPPPPVSLEMFLKCSIDANIASAVYSGVWEFPSWHWQWRSYSPAGSQLNNNTN